MSCGRRVSEVPRNCSTVHQAKPSRVWPLFAPTWKVKVLVADDNLVNRELFLLLTGGSELVVDTADNGVQALEAVRTHAYDLVFMDVQMPIMDGLEATRAIRAMGHGDLPVVALTRQRAGGGDRALPRGGHDGPPGQALYARQGARRRPPLDPAVAGNRGEHGRLSLVRSRACSRRRMKFR